MDQRRIIKISRNRIYITPDYYFTLEETNLPHINFSFKGVTDFYWEIEITAFNKETNRLTAQVINFNPENVDGFPEQKVKSHFEVLCFEKFDWEGMEPFLGLYRKSDLLSLLKSE